VRWLKSLHIEVDDMVLKELETGGGIISVTKPYFFLS